MSKQQYELEVQRFLRSEKSLEDLKNEYAIEYRIKNGKVSLNYDMIASPMDKTIPMECRGLILRENTWDIVCHPFYKFFNYGEGHAVKINWATVKFWEKLDGSLINAYYDTQLNKWCISSRSMPEADGVVNQFSISFYDLALKCFESTGVNFENLSTKLNKNTTYMFEMTSPFNRVVVDHKDFKMHLIGARDIITGKELDIVEISKEIGIPHPEIYSINNLDDMIKLINTWNPLEHEGIVACDKDFNRVKIKSLAYVSIHGAISAVSASDRNLIRIIVLGKDDDLKPIMNDILKEKTDSMKNNYVKLIKNITNKYEQIKHIDDMKTFAGHAMKSVWPSCLFAIKRGHADSINQYIVSNIESNSMADKILDLIGKSPLDILPKEVRDKLPAENICEPVFQFLSKQYPEWLETLVASKTLDAADLTYAAEWLGKTKREEAIPLIMELVEFKNPLVREGAVYGLSNFTDEKEVRRKLRIIAKEDNSKAVRDAAKDALNGI